MPVKLSSLAVFKRIPKWIHINAPFSSVSCANLIQENEHNPRNTSDVEAKIQFLRNKLCPENLTLVLDSTDGLSSALKIFKWAALQKRFRHTAQTYYSLILKLGLNGCVDEMEGFCTEMVREKCPGVEDTLVALVDSLVRHRRLHEAMRVPVAMDLAGYRPPVAVFNSFLSAIMKDERDFGSFLFVYKEMVKAGVVPTVDTLNYLLEALLEMGRVDSAMDQFRRMKRKACRPNSRTFEIIVSGLIMRNRVDEAITILNEMVEVGCEPDPSFYAEIIPLLCWVDKPAEGIKLFKMMRSSKIGPISSVSCELLIDCLCKNLWLDDAVGILEIMIEHGVAISSDVLETLIRCLCELGRLKEAKELLEDKSISETSPHNALLDCYCNAGDYVMAQGILEKMLERNIADSDSWNVIIRWLCENDRIRKASEILSRMVVSSFIPDSATFSAFVIGYCKLNEYDDAMELFYQVCSKCWVLDSTSYAELVNGLCQEKKLQQAAEVFCYMSRKRCSLQSSVFEMLIKGICSEGEVKKAIRFLSLAHSSCTPCTSAAYNAIMLRLSGTNCRNSPLVALSQMLVHGCMLNVESYCILIQSMSTQGRANDSALFFNMMVGEGFVTDAKTLADLLLCLADRSQVSLILPAVDKLLSNFEVLSSATCNILISALWKEGYESKARRLADLMLEKGWVPDAIAHGLLIGSVVREEYDRERVSNDKLVAQDNVSNILAEGLGGM